MARSRAERGHIGREAWGLKKKERKEGEGTGRAKKGWRRRRQACVRARMYMRTHAHACSCSKREQGERLTFEVQPALEFRLLQSSCIDLLELDSQI